MTGLHRVLTFNLIEHLWDESDLTDAFLEEWSNIPIDTLLNLVDSLPKRV